VPQGGTDTRFGALARLERLGREGDKKDPERRESRFLIHGHSVKKRGNEKKNNRKEKRGVKNAFVLLGGGDIHFWGKNKKKTIS